MLSYGRLQMELFALLMANWKCPVLFKNPDDIDPAFCVIAGQIDIDIWR
jgi:hypothetical protein